MIHGNCVSIGCLSMSDQRIEEIYTMASSVRQRIPVHLFPGRDIRGLISSGEQPEHHAFWRSLAPALDHFEQRRTVPEVRVEWNGAYRVEGDG
jgi:murein L,D-transpeptidase YafK